MSEDLERVLRDALDAHARASVDGTTPPPPARFTDPSSASPDGLGPAQSRHRRVWLAPVAAAAAVFVVAALAFGLTRSSDSGHGGHAQAGASSTHSVTPRAQRAKPVPAAAAVHVRLSTVSGTYGVGMPVVVLLSRRITDGKAFQQATHVTVNGQVADAAWYFETSSAHKGYPLEAHLRLRDYWPAHADIQVSMPVRGRTAGGSYRFAEDVHLDLQTGARTVSTVDDHKHTMTVTRDGRAVGSYPVSLGADRTPTSRGTKVIISKGRSICMQGPGYRECGVKDTQQLTNGGEYLHSAPWNVFDISRGIDSSNGCTNLLPDDARKLYDLLEVGDIVKFPNAKGPKMTLGAGLGDWNVSWRTWRTGGAVPTR